MKVHVVDLKSETIAAPVSVRAYLNQTITEFKQLIAQVRFLSHCLQTHTSQALSVHLIMLMMHESQNLILDNLAASVDKFTLGFEDGKFHLSHILLFLFIPLFRPPGCPQKPCESSWSAAIMTSGFSMCPTRH